MSRLSREQKRELKRQRSAPGAGGQPTAAMTPIEVHVPASADGPAGPALRGPAGATGGATVGGMPVVAAPGETVQGAVLSYLHRLALATGHPVLATIHDERIGFVVPLQVHVDGSSRYTGEPVRMTPQAPHAQPHEQRAHRSPQPPAQEHRHAPAEGHSQPPARNFAQPPVQQHPHAPAQERPQHPVRDVPQSPVQAPQPPAQRRPEPQASPLPPAPVPAARSAEAPETPGTPRRDKATYVLRAVPEPNTQPAPPMPETAPEPVRRPEPAVTAEFVPQPQPQSAPVVTPEFAPAPQSAPAPVRRPEPAVTAEFVPQPQSAMTPESAHGTAPVAISGSGAAGAPGGAADAAAAPASGAVAPASGLEPAPAAGQAAPGTPTPSTFVLRAVPEPKPLPGSASTHVLRAVPESAAAAPAPTGEFGPAPLVDPAPEPVPANVQVPANVPMPAPVPVAAPERMPAPEAMSAPEPTSAPEPKLAPEPKPAPAMDALSLMASEPEPEPKPAPVRGFDAVAESVLGPGPEEAAPERDAAAAFLAEPVARINEAVKMGRIEAAAGMAERAVGEAAQSLGQEHPEVLKLRELTAYIAYLAGDALRSFHLSLDLARVRRRHRDTRAAYGNVQSAAAAWRAVRDPLQGLHLGRDLIGVWTELTVDGGPAADDIEQLESARTRMGRLAERARAMADNPYNQTPRAHGE
ncbi:hypothetical protein ABZZ47_20505 [Streptomyces sp. NPDC006465]|uniref:hypothetical protein n=1 Tax=Streptomyces sp. NPDC006465 TaxID=3157174 RepID=UPI0033BB0B25